MKLGLEFGWGQMIFEKQTWEDFPRHFLYHTEIYFCFIVWILFSTKTPAARIRSLLVKCHTPWFPMSCGWKVPGWLHLSRWSLWNSPWETIVGLRVPRLAGWGALFPRENVFSSFICCYLTPRRRALKAHRSRTCVDKIRTVCMKSVKLSWLFFLSFFWQKRINFINSWSRKQGFECKNWELLGTHGFVGVQNRHCVLKCN